MKIDSYVTSSVLNVVLDITILLVLFFWIENSNISFVRLPLAGLVYVLLIGFSAVFKNIRFKKILNMVGNITKGCSRNLTQLRFFQGSGFVQC